MIRFVSLMGCHRFRRPQLVVEQSPNALQRVDTVRSVEEIVPPGALQLEDVPGLVCIGFGDDGAGAVGENVEIAFVHAEMQDGDVVVDGGDHVNLKTQFVSGFIARFRD